MWELSPKKGWMSEWAESPFPRVKGLNEVYVCLQLKFSAEGSLDWIGVLTLLNCQASCFCYMMHQSVQDPSWRLWHFQGIEKTQIRKFYNGKEDWNYSRWFFYQVHTLTTSHGNSAPLRHHHSLKTMKFLLCGLVWSWTLQWFCEYDTVTVIKKLPSVRL